MNYIKDPDARLDYKWDWAALTNGTGTENWLDAGETIDSHTVTATTGITVDSSTATDADTSVVAWLSGGTTNQDYTVTCHIVTTDGREDDRTFTIRCRQR